MLKGDADKWMILCFFAIGGLLFLKWKGEFSEPRDTVSVTAPAAPQGPQALVGEPRASVVYKLSPEQQNTLIQAVEYFCVKKYHRESCLHHLITCGVPCLAAVPRPQRPRILADYETLRKQRGLPPLVKISHFDEH